MQPAKRWITALALLAFFLQGLTLQTHVHQLLSPVAVKATAEHGSKTPLKSDPIDQCRLCQELHHAGRFITPSVAPTIAPPTFVVASFIVVLLVATDPATAFAWQSRAPPRH
jgi:hypothetical protein